MSKKLLLSQKLLKNVQKTSNIPKTYQKRPNVATQVPKVPLHYSVPSLTLPSPFFTRRKDANRCCLSPKSNLQPLIEHKGLVLVAVFSFFSQYGFIYKSTRTRKEKKWQEMLFWFCFFLNFLSFSLTFSVFPPLSLVFRGYSFLVLKILLIILAKFLRN